MSVNIQDHDARINDFIAPDIDWTGTLLFDNRTPGILEVHSRLNGKGFPAYEQFIEDSKGTRISTFVYSASSKSGIFRLFTSPDVYYGGTWMKIGIDKDGNFTGRLSVYELAESKGSWFEHLFQDVKYQWNEYTIDEWNKRQTNRPASND